jgi:hypothetical protein
MIVAVYVDDLVLLSDKRPDLDKLKETLSSTFRMTDLGPLSYIVGMSVVRDRKMKTITLHQHAYLKRVLETIDVKGDLKPSATPCDPTVVLSSDEPEVTASQKKEMDAIQYASTVGSLMYLMVLTQPDIAFNMSEVTRFLHEPKYFHWQAAIRIVRYLKHTPKLGIVIDGQQSFEPVTYVDAAYVTDPVTRRSHTGFMIYMCGAPVSWKSHKQRLVTLSSTESEYVAASTAVQELMWLRNYLGELGCRLQQSIIMEDNRHALVADWPARV